MFKNALVRRAVIFSATVAALTAGVVARQTPPIVDAEAAKVKNPLPSSPESIAAGKKTYDTACAGCHGTAGSGGIIVSVIEDAGGKQPPPLNDAEWDWGATDGEIFAVIRNGVPPQYYMQPWGTTLKDADIWNAVNYIKSLGKKP